MAGALEGIRVLDCTQIIAGPLAASLLSEMGADVVKVEPPQGEPWRLQAEIIPGESRNFVVQNRGKRGIAVDLKHPGAGPIREALIDWADVVLTNFRPGAAQELGLGYETLRERKPAIIACEVTAFGENGPDSALRGYDIVAQAMSGVTTSNPNLVDGLPQQVGFAPADVVTGLAIAWGITGALYHRMRTGEGQRINASLLLSALFIQGNSREITALDAEPRRQWLEDLAEARARGAPVAELYAMRKAKQPELVGNVYYRCYQTSDGYLAVGCLGPGPRERFRQALQIRDPRYEEGFDRSPESVARIGRELTAKCEALFRRKCTAAWMEHLTANDIACGPLRFVEELWEDEQVKANGYVVEYEHSLLGPLRGPAPIIQMSGSPTRVQRASPALGEHTHEVLLAIGFEPDEIEVLERRGIIRR